MTDAERLDALEVRLRSVTLHDVAFELLPGDPRSLRQIDVEAELATAWHSSDTMGVQITLALKPPNVFHFRATYRAVFSANVGVEPADDAWRMVASRVGPSVILPYVRETFSSLVQKAGLANLVFPLVNIATMWQPEEVNIDPRPTGTPAGEAAT